MSRMRPVDGRTDYNNFPLIGSREAKEGRKVAQSKELGDIDQAVRRVAMLLFSGSKQKE